MLVSRGHQPFQCGTDAIHRAWDAGLWVTAARDVAPETSGPRLAALAVRLGRA